MDQIAFHPAFGPAALAAGLLLGGTAFAADATQGREAYVRVGCWSCHGYEGQGASTGPRLAPGPAPYAAFAAIVRTPPAVMPAYSDAVLSDAELVAIHAYLQTIPPSPDPDSIPLLRLE